MRDASLLRELYMGPHINHVGNFQLCLCLTRHITAALLQGLWSLRMRFRSSKVSTSEDLFSETIKPWQNRAFSHMLHGGFDLMTSCRAMFWSCFSQCLQWNACRKWFGSHGRWSLAGDKGAWRSKVQVHQSVAHDENPILWNLAESRVFRKMGRSWKIGAPHFLSNLLAFATPAARIHLCYARHGAFESEWNVGYEGLRTSPQVATSQVSGFEIRSWLPVLQ